MAFNALEIAQATPISAIESPTVISALSTAVTFWI